MTERSGSPSDAIERFRRNYRVALLRFLPQHDEAALAEAYEIGRAALASEVSMLHIVHIHHEILGELVESEPHQKLVALIESAAELLVEALSPAHMALRVGDESSH